MKVASNRNRPTALTAVEWIAAATLSLVVLLLIIVRATHVGALWRDECEAVQFAHMKFADLLATLYFTAFPLVFPATLRIYTGLFGSSDFALRAFGAVVSIGFVLFCWISSLRINREPPMLMLALIGLNSTFLTVGAWVRGYGLGCLLLLPVFIFSGQIAERFTPARFVATLVSSFVATQCLFFDGVFVPAILLSTMIVLVLRRDIRPAMLLLAVGILIAGCYVPYIINIYFNVRPWAKVLQ